MNEKQAFHKERSGAIATAIGKLIGTRFSMLVLMTALLLTGFAMTASAQGCLDGCQRSLVECLQQSQGDPMQEAQCQDNYDDCAENCLFP